MTGHITKDEGIRVPDKNPGYTLGRGRLYLDGEYLGNTPYCRIAFRSEQYAVLFGTDVISSKNKALFLGGSKITTLTYHSKNPAGEQTHFIAHGLLLPSDVELKGDDWMQLDFCLLCNRIGWTEDPHVVPPEIPDYPVNT